MGGISHSFSSLNVKCNLWNISLPTGEKIFGSGQQLVGCVLWKTPSPFCVSVMTFWENSQLSFTPIAL